jgi:hypothetical protein
MKSKLFKAIFLNIFFTLTYSNLFAQKANTFSIYLQTQYSKTLYDRTIYNNQNAIGIGAESFYQSHSKLKPIASILFNLSLLDDKVLRLETDNTAIKSVGTTIDFRIGESYFFYKKNYFAVAVGPSFINDQILLGLKSSFGYFFPANHKWNIAVSYGNVFDRYKRSKSDYGTICISLGLKIF